MSRQCSGESEQHKYVVVEFPEEKDEEDVTPMAIVSSKWLIQDNEETYCLWPNTFKTDSARLKAVQQHVELKTENCSTNLVNIKYKSVLYQNAVTKLKQLECCQSVSESEGSELVKKNRLKRPSKYLDEFVEECSSDEELIPNPPKLPKHPASQALKPPPTKLDANKRTFHSFSVVSSPSSSTVSRCSTPLAQITECKGCKKNQELIADVLVKLDSLKEDITFIISTTVPKGSDRVDLKEIESLQKRTVEDLMIFNDQLENSKEMATVVSLLQTVGGKDIFDTARRVMSRVMTNGVACEFNWTGKHGKASFCQLKNIRNLIMVSVRKNRLCQHATEDEIEKAMKTWIRNAPDREGGRSKRKNKTLE